MIYSRDLLFRSLAWWVLTTFCNTVQRNRVLEMLFQRYNLFLKILQTVLTEFNVTVRSLDILGNNEHVRLVSAVGYVCCTMADNNCRARECKFAILEMKQR